MRPNIEVMCIVKFQYATSAMLALPYDHFLCLGQRGMTRTKALARSYVHGGLLLIMTSRGRTRTVTLAREPKTLLQQYPMHHHGYSLPDLGPGYMWALLAPFRASLTS